MASTDATRVEFMRIVLGKLGLKVNEEEQAVPSLSPLHLTSHSPTDVARLVASWSETITVVDGEDYIKGINDVFRMEKESSIWGIQGLKKAVEAVSDALPAILTNTSNQDSAVAVDSSTSNDKDTQKPKKSDADQIRDLISYTAASKTSPDQVLDYDKLIKSIVPHTTTFPTTAQTPFFNHETYYANLAHHHSKSQNHNPQFGQPLLYGQAVTSTNTILEKNPSLLRHLPTGFTFTATTQLAGRGRGANVWVAPPGALMFSTVLHHPFTLNQAAPVIFVQYIAALAIVRGIHAYAPGYERLAVKLKWPNDIYAQLPGSASNPLVKIGGILVNSSYSGAQYDAVCGIGLNLDNPLPTTSLNSLIPSLTSSPSDSASGSRMGAGTTLKPLTHEKLLASILACFEELYRDFCRLGWTRDMEEEYYAHWLHSGQVVELDTAEVSGVRARIKGITRDWGLLLAEELGWQDRPTGRVVSLQSDSNSFDFFRGLVMRKL